MASGDTHEAGLPDNNSKIGVEKKLKCDICDIGIRKEGVKCITCENYAHSRCIEKEIKEKNLLPLERKYWQCKKCIEKSEQETNMEVESRTTNITRYQAQVDVLNKLVKHLETIIKLQEQKICDLEAQKQTISAISSLNQPNTSYFDNINISSGRQVASYSGVVKNKNSLIIRPNDKNRNKKLNVENELKKVINPTAMKINIAAMKSVASGGVLINCDDESSLVKLKANLETQLSGSCSVELPRKLNPRLKILNVNSNDIPSSEKEICEQIIARNDLSANANDIKLIKQLQNKHNNRLVHLVIQVNSEIETALLNRSYVYFGWKKCHIEQSYHIVRCFKCSKFGHVQDKCRSKDIVCPVCCDNHELKNCKSSTQKCANCAYSNHRFGTTFDIKHPAMEPTCPSYQRLVENLKLKISLGNNSDA